MTIEERRWMDAITQLGCIVCYLQGHRGSPAVVHHILKNGRRQTHLQTIALCDPGHHQQDVRGSSKIARHPTKARFEAAYGTEEYLLERTRQLINRERA